MRKRILVATLVCLFIATATVLPGAFIFVGQTQAAGNTYYVATTGSDSNPGTSNQPWRTIQYAANTSNSGDTVIVKSGTYNERVNVTKAGTASIYTVFKADPAKSVNMNGFELNAQYIKVEGFKVSGVGDIAFEVGASNLIIESNEVIENRSMGAGTWDALALYANVVIKNNYVYRSAYGVVAAGDGWLIEGNEVERLISYAEGDNDYMRFFGKNHIFRRNYLHGTRVTEICPPGWTGPYDPSVCAHVDGFQTFSNNNYTANNVIFDGNFVVDFHQGATVQNNGFMNISGLIFRNNVFVGGTSETISASWGIQMTDLINTTVENNYFFNVGAAIGMGGVNTGTIRNNIFNGAYSTPYVFENQQNSNAVKGGNNINYKSNQNVWCWQCGEVDIPLPGDTVNPNIKMVNPDNPLGADGEPFTTDDGYRLQSGSPAIDAGLVSANGPTTDIFGSARPVGIKLDIGPHEFSTATAPACTPNWSCTSWNSCSSTGQQSRTCTDTNNCGITTGKPAVTQSCTPASTSSNNSLKFVANSANNYEYGKQTTLPTGFGSGEFTLELWIKPDNSFPIGATADGTAGQLTNWDSGDSQPYSSGSWWWDGNFLLDGHNNSNFINGTFSLQFYNGGRLRWDFGDGVTAGLGGHWAVQATPGSATPSLLDGGWHNVNLVRRWSGTTNALLEMWIDGKLIATTTSTARTNMASTYWNSWAGYPSNQDGWFWGAEKQAAINILSQYEDYKGLLDEIRFWNKAKSTTDLQTNWNKAVVGTEAGLVGWYRLSSSGNISTVCNELNSNNCITLNKFTASNFSTENAPVQSSTAPACTPNWSCASWNSCSMAGSQSRICTDINNCGVNTNKPSEIQSCVPPVITPIICTPNWSCSDWNICTNKNQTRSCVDLNRCGTTRTRPAQTQSCLVPVDPSNVGRLVKLTCSSREGTNQACRTVYFVANNGKRYVFPNEPTYKTWYSDFRSLQVLTYEQISQIPLGGVVTSRPGAHLVKFDTDPKVYAVGRGGVLRWVTSEALAIELYGIYWNRQIDEIQAWLFNSYTFGLDINNLADYNPSAILNEVTNINSDKGL